MDASYLILRQRLLQSLALQSMGINPQVLATGVVPVITCDPLLALVASSPVVAAPVATPASPVLTDTEEKGGAPAEWSSKEDELLKSLIAEHGTSKWSRIASKMGSKSNRQCRRRWQAILNSMGNKGSWTAEEDAKLMEGHRRFGNRWTDIAKLVPGRTDNAVKNRFAALVAKGEGVSAPKIRRWSDVCALPKDSAAEPQNKLRASDTFCHSPSAASADSSSFSSKRKAPESDVPSLKRLKNFVDLDLNVAADASRAWWASDSDTESQSEGSCIEAASESCDVSLTLDLNAPAHV